MPFETNAATEHERLEGVDITFTPTLEGLLSALQEEGIQTLPTESIMNQLANTGTAIVTRDYRCGIRISRVGSKRRGFKYIVWVTNDLENPEHTLNKRFDKKEISIT